MSDTHGLSFNVDTSGIAKGMDAYRSAVSGISASLKQFEAQATKTFATIGAAASNRSNLSSFAKSMSGLSNIDIDTSAARKITQLSTAIQGFRGPSAAVSDNLNSFFRSLSRMPELGGAAGSVRTIQSLSNALANFKAPSSAASTNLVNFAKSVNEALPGIEKLRSLSGLMDIGAEMALLGAEFSKLKPPSTTAIANIELLAHALKEFNTDNLAEAGRIGQALSGIANFKAPSAAQIKNLENFIKALNDMKPPQNAAGIASSINTITAAAQHASSAMGGYRTGMSSLGSGFKTVSSGSHEASVNLMGLQNAFSGTFQVGSVLRTLLGSLTLGELGHAFFDATQQVNQFRASMDVVDDTPGFSAKWWNTVTQAANNFGVPIRTVTEGFGNFAIAAKEAGASTEKAWSVYSAFTMMAGVRHLPTEQIQSMNLALQSMMDRGFVTTNDVTRQLGRQVPGLLKILDGAVKEASHGQETALEALKKHQISAIAFSELAAKHIDDVYGKAIPQALESPIQQFNILKNNLQQLFIAIGDSNATKAFAGLIHQIAGYIDPGNIKGLAKSIGDDLAVAINKASQGIAWLHDNWSAIKGPLAEGLKLLGAWMVTTAAIDITKGFISPFRTLIGIGPSAVGVLRDIWFFASAINATNMTSFYGSLSKITSPAIVSGAVAVQTALGKLGSLSLGGTLAAGFTALKNAAVGAAAAILNPSTSIPAGLAKLQGFLTSMNPQITGFFGTFAAGAAAAAGGLLAAFGTMTNTTNAMYGTNYTVVEEIRGAWALLTAWLPTAWDSVTGYISNLWNGLFPNIQISFGSFGTFVSNFLINLTAGFQTAVSSIAVMWRAMFKTFSDGMAGFSSGWDKLKGGDLMGAAGAFASTTAGLATGADFAKNAYKGFKDEFNSYVTSDRDGLGALGQVLGAAGRKAGSATAKPVVQPKPAATPALPPVGTDNILGGPGNGDKKKASEKAENQLKSFESMWDDLMQKLAGSDPVSKLNAEFTKTLDNAGKLMLTDGAYNTFVGGIRKDANDTSKQLQDLENQLKSGHLSDAAKKALSLSGENADDLIDKLDDLYKNLQSKIKDALEKSYQKTYQGMQDALKKASEKNPVLKVQVDASTNLEAQSKDLLNADGFKAMEPALNGVMDGSMSAKDGIEQLIAQLQAGRTESTLSAAALDLYVSSLRQQEVVEARNLVLAKQKATFGFAVLKGLKDEGLQYQLNTKDLDTYNKLQEAVNAANEAGIPLDQQKVDLLTLQIQAYEKQNELLQKQKELYDNNGIRQWASETEQAQDAVQGLNKDLADGLEKSLEQLGNTGKMNFKSLLTTMRQDIVKYEAQGATKDIINAFTGGKTFGAQGQMLPGSNPNFFGNVLGQNSMPYFTADEWSGKAGYSTMKLDPKYDPKTGMLTNNGMGNVPLSAQPLATALKAANKYDSSGNLMVAIGGAASADPHGAVAGGANATTGAAAPLQAAWDKAANALRVTLTGQQGQAVGPGSGTGTGLGGGTASASNPLGLIRGGDNNLTPYVDSSTLQNPALNITRPGYDSFGISQDGSSMQVGKVTATSNMGVSAQNKSFGSMLQNGTGLLGGPATLGLLGGGLGALLGGSKGAKIGGIAGTLLPGLLGGASGIGGFLSQIMGTSTTGGNTGLLGTLFGSGAGATGGLGSLFSGLFGGSSAAGAGGAASGGILSLFKGLFGGGTAGSSGGLLSMFSGLFGGGAGAAGGLGGAGSLLGLFGLREGGIMGSLPRSFTSGHLPAFSEGTTNTGSFGGGLPAVLHSNEAVIPLSRGRSIPVDMSGVNMGSSTSSGTNITFNVTSPDPDSFKRSQSQLSTQAYAIGQKAAQRNGAA